MSFTPPNITNNDFYLGTDNNVNAWFGQLDEIRISTKQRSATEIQDRYNAQGASLHHDEFSSLILHFENSMIGEIQESAAVNTGLTYGAGVFDRSAYFNGNEDLQYPALNNITSDEGSFEIWVKPNFDPEPTINDYTLLGWGGGGGILIFINQGSYLRLITNRYGFGGNVEIGIGHDVADWNANEWHHIACTWSSNKIKMYVDGSKVSEAATNFNLPVISQPQFHIGSDSGNNKWSGHIDEIRISESVRTETEIANSFFAGLGITGLTLKEITFRFFPIGGIDLWFV